MLYNHRGEVRSLFKSVYITISNAEIFYLDVKVKWEGHGDEADPKFLQAPCAEWVLCLICRVFSILNHLYEI